MDLQELARQDSLVMFKDFPELSLKTVGGVELTVRGLQSFVNMMSQLETGVDVSVDSVQVSVNAQTLIEEDLNLLEDDIVTIKDLGGKDREFRIKHIDRDRTIGIWVCELQFTAEEDEAGDIDRAEELIKQVDDLTND